MTKVLTLTFNVNVKILVIWPYIQNLIDYYQAIPEKSDDILFLKNSSNFQVSKFLILGFALEILEKTMLDPSKSHKIVLKPIELPRPKTKTPGNSGLFFPDNPWKFHFYFN